MADTTSSDKTKRQAISPEGEMPAKAAAVSKRWLRKPRRPQWLTLAACIMAVGGAGAWYRWRQQLKALPPGFAAANGLVVVPTAAASIWLIVHELIGVPVAGSIPLFLSGTVLYQISVGPLGILPATITSSMGQFGLLLIPVDTVLDLLSGSTIPMASIPPWLQTIMQLAPTIHFIDVSRAVLYRGAGLDIVWLLLLALSAFSIAVLGISLIRFRTAVRT